MDWTEVIARIITLDTFSNVWYWAAVVVSWAVACHWLIGVPFDMLVRARRGKGREMADLEAMVDINVRRIIWFQDIGGAGFAALAAFFLAGTGLLAIGYRFELAIGVLILALPLFVVVLVNLRLALALHANPLKGQELVARLFRVRLWTQGIAAISLFATSALGMAYAIDTMRFF
ncbi:hypothetical protein [Yoonia sp.]|uniref:hypothetical protein n=1 Tax=Yoonia sp. TaxID=2212373 RepID=UPI002FDA93E3